MSAPTSTSRVQKLRQERREAGLVRIELYVPGIYADKIRDTVAEVVQILTEADKGAA